VADTLVKAAPDAQLNDIKALLGRMLFTGKSVQKKARPPRLLPPPAGLLAVQLRAALHAAARSAALQIHREVRYGMGRAQDHTCSVSEQQLSSSACGLWIVLKPRLHVPVLLPQEQHAHRRQAAD